MRRSVGELDRRYRYSSASREAAVEIGRAHSSEKRMDVGVQRCWNGDGKRVNGTQRGGQTTSSESLKTSGTGP
ncbi:jg13215 [Pararge aegeria aegeria]|uniref:Jg13215 protein n=1 Tax=Pararge aegeria aegeria TaxID=348720 RepID=A0A8S4RD59_9NEOP|nr:jg13215 [Pararge aegeria aegeria]